MSAAFRTILLTVALLGACSDRASLVQPTSDCQPGSTFTIYLEGGFGAAEPAVRELAARHRFTVVELVEYGPLFVAVMSPRVALEVAKERSVQKVEPGICYDLPIEGD